MPKVTHLIRAAITAPNGTTVTGDVRWTYLSDQPWEVIFTLFEERPDVEVECGFSREMLQRGLVTPQGEGHGDIHVRAGLRSITIVWELPAGETIITLPIEEVRDFLVSSYRLVPVGEESMSIPPSVPLSWVVQAKDR